MPNQVQLIAALSLATALFAGPHSTTISTVAQQRRYEESGRHRAIRWAIGAAACGLSAYDATMTVRYTGHGGIVESNGLYAGGANGAARVGPMIGLKLGMCATPLVIGELGRHFHSQMGTDMGLIGSAGVAGANTLVIKHNLGVLKGSGK
jgi:hypothetical protein